MLEKETKLLFDAITNKMGIKELTQLIQKEIFDNPVLITNAYFKTISMSSDVEVKEEVWEFNDKYQCCPKEALAQFYHDYISTKQYQDKEPFYYDTNHAKDIHRLLSTISYGSETYGYLTVYEVKHKLDEVDVEKTKLVSKALGYVLSLNMNIEANFEYFYRQLLEMTEDNRYEMENEIQKISPLFRPNFTVIVARPNSQNNVYISHVCDHINAIQKNVNSFIYKNFTVIVINYLDDEEREGILAKVVEIINEAEFAAGISMPFTDLIRFKEYVLQANRGRKLGSVIDSGKNIYEFTHYMVYDALSRYGKEELKTFICPEYKLLKKHDDENNSEFIKTCFAYVLSGCNAGICAQQLHVHRNTLFYRLKNIEKVGKFSLEDINTLTLVLISDYIHKWIQLKYESN
ncbi:MAG: helix-turn-helix domain-containing protein [Bacillota bacterium]|nr:helix-turn-helix domain-containing protein [Bacillota bacterium]